jgi:hypothetical protein
MSESRMSGEPHVRIDRGRLAEPTPTARQNMHPFGKPRGLSLPDLPVPAEPAAYLTKWFGPDSLRVRRREPDGMTFDVDLHAPRFRTVTMSTFGPRSLYMSRSRCSLAVAAGKLKACPGVANPRPSSTLVEGRRDGAVPPRRHEDRGEAARPASRGPVARAPFFDAG